MKPIVKNKVKLQSRIPITTRERLVKTAKANGVTGTQMITELIKQEFEQCMKGE